jgi:hypothetical protein
MIKQFRNRDLSQAYLLPPSLQDWLPEGHLARFVADLVETLDLLSENGGEQKCKFQNPYLRQAPTDSRSCLAWPTTSPHS